jgi:hypothetical protein
VGDEQSLIFLDVLGCVRRDRKRRRSVAFPDL